MLTSLADRCQPILGGFPGNLFLCLAILTTKFFAGVYAKSLMLQVGSISTHS